MNKDDALKLAAEWREDAAYLRSLAADASRDEKPLYNAKADMLSLCANTLETAAGVQNA